MAETDRVRWDARYRTEGPERREPASFLVAISDLLSPCGHPTALDVAGGAGRNAVFLARLGFAVTVADISPAGLALARAAAAAEGLSVRCVEIDFERAPLLAGPFDLVVTIDFLHRPLFNAFPGTLAPGGLLIVAHPTRANLARHPHPSARFLLDEGELPRLVSGLVVLRYEEGWSDDRHQARLVARKP